MVLVIKYKEGEIHLHKNTFNVTLLRLVAHMINTEYSSTIFNEDGTFNEEKDRKTYNSFVDEKYGINSVHRPATGWIYLDSLPGGFTNLKRSEDTRLNSSHITLSRMPSSA